uniref:Uncharacterized protein n=1 Tax=Cacopsylla melanoneura TaxID=428564 RepID=A0A8D8T6J0_9HEMI
MPRDMKRPLFACSNGRNVRAVFSVPMTFVFRRASHWEELSWFSSFPFRQVPAVLINAHSPSSPAGKCLLIISTASCKESSLVTSKGKVITFNTFASSKFTEALNK